MCRPPHVFRAAACYGESEASIAGRRSMHDIVHSVIAFLKQHQDLAFPVMFLVSFGESFVGLSLLFPGTTIMVLAGTLVHWPLNPHGELDLWPPLIGGFCGAVVGDAISFWIGTRFGHLLDRHWYFQRHPEILERGYAFFNRFGVGSVFVGRFFGPVRAVIPLVAGIMEMRWGEFWLANVGSALVWAPSLMLLGTILRRLAHILGARHEWVLITSVLLAIALLALIWAARQYRVMNWLRGWLGHEAR
jgi:membrane protein DedA with SNARE-associated domain